MSAEQLAGEPDTFAFEMRDERFGVERRFRRVHAERDSAFGEPSHRGGDRD